MVNYRSKRSNTHENVKKATGGLSNIGDREKQRLSNIKRLVERSNIGAQFGRFLEHQHSGPPKISIYSVVEALDVKIFDKSIKTLSPVEKCIKALGKDRVQALTTYGAKNGTNALHKLVAYLIGDFSNLLSTKELTDVNTIISFNKKSKVPEIVSTVYSDLIQIEKGLLSAQSFEDRVKLFHNNVSSIIRANKRKTIFTDFTTKEGKGFKMSTFDISDTSSLSVKESFIKSIGESGSLSLICVNQKGFDEEALLNHIDWCKNNGYKFYKPSIWFFESERGKIDEGKYSTLGAKIKYLSDADLSKSSLEKVSKKLFDITHPNAKQ